MKNKGWWISAVALVIGLIIGFILANSFNRSELNNLRAENQSLKQNNSENRSQKNDDLSDDEIRNKISEADQNPQNFAFQKNLGIGLYRYATVKENVDLLSDVEKILRRAHQLNENDYDVTINLGHSVFDSAYAKKDNEKFIQAREIYQTALRQKNDDEIRIDYSLTYLFINPPETEKTITELNKVLQNNPNQERALQFKAQALAIEKKWAESKAVISELRKINPDNPAIADLEKQIEQIQ